MADGADVKGVIPEDAEVVTVDMVANGGMQFHLFTFRSRCPLLDRIHVTKSVSRDLYQWIRG